MNDMSGCDIHNMQMVEVFGDCRACLSFEKSSNALKMKKTLQIFLGLVRYLT